MTSTALPAGAAAHGDSMVEDGASEGAVAPWRRTDGGPSGGVLMATGTLWQREMVRFFRQRSRVIGAFLFPIVIWIFLGAGVNHALPVAGGASESAAAAAATASTASAATSINYGQYLFPGVLVMILLFTGIFSTVTVIEDRREGFLQAVLVAPVPRLGIVLGKVFGGASIATVQGAIFLLFWPLVGGYPGIENGLAAIGVMFLLAAGLTSLSLCLAWPMDSTAGFHAMMNLVLMPMWLLCGAVFPVATAQPWLKTLMYLDPLTYGQSLMVTLLLGPQTAAATGVAWPIALPVTAALCVVGVLAAVVVAGRVRG